MRVLVKVDIFLLPLVVELFQLFRLWVAHYHVRVGRIGTESGATVQCSINYCHRRVYPRGR